jgi:PPOX class probable F420-dependent enzyme
VARLATHHPNGGIDLVPVTFAFLDDDTIVTAVDHKPKRTPQLQRLENIRTNPSVTVLVDHYDDDWSALWWVRVRGEARVVAEPARDVLEPLVAKYEQYRAHVPAGPAILIRVVDVHGWSARA